MLDLFKFAHGDLFHEGILVAGNTLALVGLILLASLTMDELDARFGLRGFFGILAGIGVFGGIGGFAGWEIHQRSGAYVGAYICLITGIAVTHLALKLMKSRLEVR